MKTYIKEIIVIFILIVLIVPLNSYAEETWDAFFERVKEYDWPKGKTQNGESIEVEDINRMAAGPVNVGEKDKDKLGEAGYADYILPEFYTSFQDSAVALLNGNEEDPDNAKILRKKIVNFLYSEDYKPDEMSAEELKAWMDEIKRYKQMVGGDAAFDRDGDLVHNDMAAKFEEMNGNYKQLTGTDGYTLYGDPITVEDIQKPDILYQNPEVTDETKTTVGTIKDVMQDASTFINKGSSEKTNPLKLDEKSLQKFSKTISGILLTVGIVITVIMGGILGIQFMTGSVSDKAEVKKMLAPYVVGCVVVFGAVTIWGVAVNFGEKFDSIETTVATGENPETSTSGDGTSENKDTESGGDTSKDNEDTGTSGTSSKDKNNQSNKKPNSSSTSSGDKTSSDKKPSKETNVKVRTVLMDRKILMLDKDHYDKARLQCFVYPKNATDKKLKWESSNKSVAVVDSKGSIKAKSAGTAVITATTENGKKAKCTVTVIRQMTKSNGKWAIQNVKWTKEQLESYINNAEGLCKTKDFYNYPEAASGTFPAYTGNATQYHTLKNTRKDIVKDVGISATDYLILTTTMNQRIHFFKKNGGIWELIDEDYASTGVLKRPTEKRCWCADCVKAGTGHNRFDFYIGAMYPAESDGRKACFEFWQCGIGSWKLEGTGGIHDGTEPESHYSHRAFHTTDNPPASDYKKGVFGQPTTSGCVSAPLRMVDFIYRKEEMLGTRMIVY